VLTYVWLLTLHITPVKLLYSWMENTVIQHTFLKFDQNKKTDFQSKPQIKQKKPDLLNKTSSGNIGPEAVKPDPRCSWKGHSGGGCRCRRWSDSLSYCSITPARASKPPQERDAWCQFLAKWLKVSAIGNASDLSNVTLRYLDWEQKGRASFL